MIPQEPIQRRTPEEIMDVLVLETQEQVVEAVKVQQIMREIVDVRLTPQECVQRAMEDAVDIQVGVIKGNSTGAGVKTHREADCGFERCKSQRRPWMLRGRSLRSAFNAPSNKVWMGPYLRSWSGSCKLANNALVSVWVQSVLQRTLQQISL